jgi:hypothetical protein
MTSVASLFACHPADVTLERIRELVDVGQPESLTLEIGGSCVFLRVVTRDPLLPRSKY